MSDPCLIPLLDPTPTQADKDAAMRFFNKFGYEEKSWGDNYAHVFAAERVRIAREAIEWAIGDKPDIDGKCTCLEHRLKWHDAAIAERGKK